MKVLMVGVDQQTKGGMWTVAENYLRDESFCTQTNLKYIPTSITGSVPARLAFTAKALAKVFASLLAGKYDIVHVHMAERGSVYRKNLVMCMAKFFGSKVVIHMHGAEFETWYRAQNHKTQARIRRILNRGDRILILGDYWKEFICSLVDVPEKVQVLYNAVPVPGQNLYDSGSTNILFLGAVCQRKGIQDLLQAVRMTGDQLGPAVKVLIYGPDRGEQPIDQLIREMGVTDRVEYCGWLTAESRQQVFSQTALNVLPSYNEGLPMTILETMAQGIPNISTPVAAIPEAVDAYNGAIVAPGDAEGLGRLMVQLMNDPAMRQEKSGQAYRKAQEMFSIERHLEKILDIYRELSDNNV